MIEPKVTSYIFFKVGNHYEYIKDGMIYTYTEEMIACLKNQYRMMGFMIFADCEGGLIVSRVDNEIEIFSEKLSKRG